MRDDERGTGRGTPFPSRSCPIDPRQGRAGQGGAGRGRAGQSKAGRGRAEQGRARLELHWS